MSLVGVWDGLFVSSAGPIGVGDKEVALTVGDAEGNIVGGAGDKEGWDERTAGEDEGVVVVSTGIKLGPFDGFIVGERVGERVSPNLVGADVASIEGEFDG